MHPAERRFVAAIDDAGDLADIRRACARFEDPERGKLPKATPDFSAALASVLHAHLLRRCNVPAYTGWLDVYFGRRQSTFRSALQQPSFLYYPSLAPVPWFEGTTLPGLEELQPAIAPVADEILAYVGSTSDFQPYVGLDAAGDARWKGLSGSDAWSSIHLIKGGRLSEHLAKLPRTNEFLARAPLAQCPPHAPECFVSRLSAGVELPPHHGVSNLKLTVHLPIEVPDGDCSITVGGETRRWKLGEFLVFDDSFLHSAANRAQSSRAVLIFDVWHPELSADEKGGLAYAIATLDMVNKVAWAR